MKQLPLVIACLLSFILSQAQTDSTQSKKVHKPSLAYVRTYNSKIIKGWLYAANDS
jgi:hypothetical protein